MSMLPRINDRGKYIIGQEKIADEPTQTRTRFCRQRRDL